MCRPTETDLVRQCLDLLRLHNIPAWRANAGGGLRGGRLIRGNPAGTPDVLAVLPPAGRLLGLECKSPTGKLRPAQEAWADNARKAGAYVWLVRDVKTLERWLQQEGIIE